MAKRPYISKRIDELEQIFKSSGTDLLTLKSLENELVHRSTPRAVSLLKAVRKTVSLPQFTGRVVDPNLFDPQPISTKEGNPTPPKRMEPAPGFALNAPPPPHPVSVVKRTVLPPRLAPRGEPIPFPVTIEPKPEAGATVMSPEEACRVLQVILGADWETIEKSRREIVEKSNPDKVRSVTPERRRALIEHARRANKANPISSDRSDDHNDHRAGGHRGYESQLPLAGTVFLPKDDKPAHARGAVCRVIDSRV